MDIWQRPLVEKLEQGWCQGFSRLERVFLVGLENLLSRGTLPDVSEDTHAQSQEEHARKLYMVMTRAGQRLILVTAERLVDTIEQLFLLPEVG